MVVGKTNLPKDEGSEVLEVSSNHIIKVKISVQNLESKSGEAMLINSFYEFCKDFLRSGDGKETNPQNKVNIKPKVHNT